jgi:membrane associated rhomboid family serine protease
MPFSSRSYVNRYIPSNRFPVGLKWLLIANIGISVLDFVLRASNADTLLQNLALVPAQVVQTFAIWQVVTYMFLHAGIGHVLWNMLALWLFGIELERAWGTRRFLRFYFACGIIAAFTVILAAYIFGGVNLRTVGSSGAVYGILVAYALVFPDQTVLFGGRRLRTQLSDPVVTSYKDWKLRRAKRKFEVYLRKRDSDRDRWVH